MITSSELIARVRAHVARKKGLKTATDYATAKALGIHQTAMTARKSGETKGMSDDTAIRAADLLGLDRAYVLACIQAERAERLNLSSASTWRRIAETFGRAAAVAGFFVLAVGRPSPSTAGEAPGATISRGLVSEYVYYVKTLLRGLIWGICPILGRRHGAYNRG